MRLKAGLLRDEFKSRTEAATLSRYQQFHREEELRRKRREEARENARDDAADFAFALITSAEAAQFRAELDVYDTATVTALQESSLALDKAQERIDALLIQAHVLPDGRRVFKTQDGQRVFDENGLELNASVVRPELIEDHRPRWETYQPIREERDRLRTEHEAILKYQQNLDDARERLDSGQMTRREFDQLRDELRTTMPDAVRRHVPGMNPTAEPTPAATQARAETTLEISADMVPTRTGPGLQ